MEVAMAVQKEFMPAYAKQTGNKIFAKAKTFLKHENPNTDDLSTLIGECNVPEEWIGFCFALESSPYLVNKNILKQAWELGLSKFKNSAIYLESIGFYYYRERLHKKAKDYLKKASKIQPSVTAIKLQMATAYGSGNYSEVLDCFEKLSPQDQDKLEDDLLAKTATAALMEGNYSLSETLLAKIKKRRNLPELPTLEESLMQRFESPEKLGQWVDEMRHKAKNKKERDQVATTEWITYASALMFEKNYKEALELLLTIKKERYGEDNAKKAR
ncbi:MAG: hypothetical protein D6767_06370 [Candidatus Hydrogenedentota bacterium]|nr:MAG: hypothetical protein D6767_06370 [Candidatus Hydrogenedentota bacterium]